MIFEKPENLKVKRIGGSWYLIYRNYEKVYLLNNTGLDMLLAIIDGTPTQTLLLNIAEKYQVKVDMIESDYIDFYETIKLIDKGDSTKLSNIHNKEEQVILRNRVSRNILSAVLELTNGCSFDCLHCYLDKNNTIFQDYDRVIWVLDELNKCGCYSILLTGGEPLIHPDFVKIYKYASEIGFKVSVYTNGYFLSDDIVDIFKKYPPSMLAITLYGFDKESYSAFTKVSDSFENVSNNLQQYSDLGIPIKTRTQLHKLNYHDIEKYKLLAASFGLNFSLRSFVCPPNNDDQYFDKINLNLPPEDIVYYEKKYKDPIVDSTNDLVQQMKNTTPSQFNSIEWVCGGGITSCLIDCEMKMSPCVQIREPNVKLDELNIIDAWYELGDKLEMLIRDKQVTNLAADCKGCVYKENCNICVAWILRINEPFMKDFVDEYMCKIAQIRYCGAIKKYIKEKI